MGGAALPARLATGMFIGQHGSWNRRARSGYNVVLVPFARAGCRKNPVEVLCAVVGADGDAHGRPVGVALERRGALLVADDVGDTIWRVSAAPAP